MQWRFAVGEPAVYARDATLQRAEGSDDALIEAGRMLSCDMATDDGEFDIALVVDEPLPEELAAKTVQRDWGILHLPSGKLKHNGILKDRLFSRKRLPDDDIITIAPGTYAVEAAWLHWPREEHEQKVRAIVGEEEYTKLQTLRAQHAAQPPVKSKGCFPCLVMLGLLVLGIVLAVIAVFLDDAEASPILGIVAVACIGIAVLGPFVRLLWAGKKSGTSFFDSEYFRQTQKIGRLTANLDEPFVVLSVRRLAEGETPPSARGLRTTCEWRESAGEE